MRKSSWILGLLEWMGTVPWKGVAAVFGGFLLQFTMGAFYSFGNMSTYMTSYMRQNGSPHITYTGFFIIPFILFLFRKSQGETA